MDEACDGLDLTRMDCYVGVSSGAFLAAGLARPPRHTETTARLQPALDDTEQRMAV